MKKNKIYIAGKVTGLPYEECCKKFETAEKIFRSKGWEVVNPMRIVPEHTEWKIAMQICIAELVECDAYHMLPCWKKSTGAKLERKIARSLNLQEIKS
jgi:hypothetical protein